MFVENENTYGVKQLSIIKSEVPENSLVEENRSEARRAGAFLKTSGLNDVVTNFATNMFGKMFGRIVIPRNEYHFSGSRVDEPLTLEANASFVLRWEDLELRKFIFKVTAVRFEEGDKALTASLYENLHSRKKSNTHDDVQGPYVSIMRLNKTFDFGAPVTEDKKEYYRIWLKERFLNVDFFQGEEIIPSPER